MEPVSGAARDRARPQATGSRITSIAGHRRRYDDNGGTVLAVAGDDYCVVAGSKRLSTGYSILTRDQSKIVEL